MNNREVRVPKHMMFVVLFAAVVFLWMVLVLLATSYSSDMTVLAYLNLLLVAGLSVLFTKHSVRASIYVLAVIFVFQPILTMPVSHLLESDGVRALVATKEVYSLVLLACLAYRNFFKITWRKVDIVVLLFAGLYLLYSLNTAPLGAKLASLREGIMVVVYIFIGRFSLLKISDVRWLLRQLIWLAVVVSLLGLIERMFVSSDMWYFWGAVDYVNAKRESGASVTLDQFIPNQWYTFVGGEIFRRMVSTLGDPTSLSRFLALPILAMLYIPMLIKKTYFLSGYWPVLLILFSALLLSMGRGGQIIVLGGVSLLFIYRLPKISILISPVVLIVVMNSSFFSSDAGSGARHILGVVAGIESLLSSPMGHGVGTAGQQARNFGNGEAASDIKESYFASLSYQLGYPGVFSYALLFIGLMWVMAGESKKYRKLDKEYTSYFALGFALAGGILITSILSNSAISPISAGLPLIYIGAIITCIKGGKSELA